MQGAEAEAATMIRRAVRTDLILSAEIMVIALKEVLDESACSAGRSSWSSSPLLITVIVYGVVALIVKMDDIGLALAQRESESAQRVGRMLVNGMPKLLAVLVGRRHGRDALGRRPHPAQRARPARLVRGSYDQVHHLEEAGRTTACPPSAGSASAG